MASTPKSDADCIESAYEDALGGLFKQLFANLAGAGGGNILSHGTGSGGERAANCERAT